LIACSSSRSSTVYSIVDIDQNTEHRTYVIRQFVLQPAHPEDLTCQFDVGYGFSFVVTLSSGLVPVEMVRAFAFA
jgi:hypothetical protein